MVVELVTFKVEPKKVAPETVKPVDEALPKEAPVSHEYPLLLKPVDEALPSEAPVNQE